MRRDEVIEKAAVLIGGFAPFGAGQHLSREVACVLFTAGLLPTPALIRCGEACIRYDEAPGGPAAETAWQECSRAGRALKAEREGDGPWRVRLHELQVNLEGPNGWTFTLPGASLPTYGEQIAELLNKAWNSRSCEHDWSWSGADAHCRKCGQPAKP